MIPPVIDNHGSEAKRSQAWLEKQFELLWCNHFFDVERPNKLVVKWGRVSRTRLGTITARGGNIYDAPDISEIRVNPLLQSPSVPVSVVWQTMAHEAAHYCHGFCSPHPRQFSHPHRGNVILKEFAARNLVGIHDEAHVWLKTHWSNYVASQVPVTQRRKRRKYGKSSLSLLSNWKRRISRRRRLGGG